MEGGVLGWGEAVVFSWKDKEGGGERGQSGGQSGGQGGGRGAKGCLFENVRRSAST